MVFPLWYVFENVYRVAERADSDTNTLSRVDLIARKHDAPWVVGPLHGALWLSYHGSYHGIIVSVEAMGCVKRSKSGAIIHR
jgi:hypothetical protein